MVRHELTPGAIERAISIKVRDGCRPGFENVFVCGQQVNDFVLFIRCRTSCITSCCSHEMQILLWHRESRRPLPNMLRYRYFINVLCSGIVHNIVTNGIIIKRSIMYIFVSKYYNLCASFADNGERIC